MEQVTTEQPLPQRNQSENVEEPLSEITATFFPLTDESVQNDDNDKSDTTKALFQTESDAGYNDETGNSDTIEEKEKKMERRESVEVNDCCCVFIDKDDPLWFYFLCGWLSDCCKCIGECTDSCFEDCASCLSSCCESHVDDGVSVGADSCGSCDCGCID